MNLNPRIAGITIGGRLVAEKLRASTEPQDLSGPFVVGGVKAKGFRRHASREKRLDQPPGSKRLLAAGLQHHRDLKRNRRQPERVHGRRIARHDDTERVGRREITYGDAALFAEAFVDDAEIEPARQTARGWSPSARARC